MYSDKITVGKADSRVTLSLTDAIKVEVDLVKGEATLTLKNGETIIISNDQAILFISNNQKWRPIEN